jgi:hypothetical protein
VDGKLMRSISMLWAGVSYEIRPTQAFRVGEKVEDILTLQDIANFATQPKMRKLARAYAVMLTEAGARVTNEEVFAEIMKDAAAGQNPAAEAISALVNLLTGDLPASGEGDAPEKTSAS